MTFDTLNPASAPTPVIEQRAAKTSIWSAVLFDLDGTLVDSADDITTSLAETFRRMGQPVPNDDALRESVGPPLLETLRTVGGFDEARAWEALELYRQIYKDRALKSPVFPGISGMLQRLHSRGIPIALATSKPEPLAREILETADLAKYFTVIAGATEDETRSTKADVVALALSRLAAAKIDSTNTVMVGDRAYDVVGAQEHGVPTILVEWGYGSPAEAAGAFAVVHSTDKLRVLLGG